MVRKLAWGMSLAAGLAGGFGGMRAANAQLIAYDGFEESAYEVDGYPLQETGPLEDQGDPLVSPGWTGTPSEPSPASQKWVSNGTQNVLYDLVSLAHPAVSYDDASTGKVEFKAYASPQPDNFHTVRRVIDDYTPADTYYMSFLLSTTSVPADETGQRGQAVVGFVNNVGGAIESNTQAAYNNQTGAPTFYGLMVGFDGRGDDERINDLVLRARKDIGSGPEAAEFANTVLVAGEVANPQAPANEHVSTLENVTHLVMLKLEVNVSDEIDLVTYWVNPTDVSTEALATSTAQATGTVETYAMDQNDRITRLRIIANEYEDRYFYFDEARLGYDFYSVAGVASPLPDLIGDFNDDGVVDAADYTVWRDNLGSTAVLPNDDSPGAVDQSDYEDWVANFGLMSSGGGAGLAVAVPEPVGWGLGLFVAIACVRLSGPSWKLL